MRTGQLVVQLPLQPAVKVDVVRVFDRELRHRRATRVAEFARPLVPVVAVVLGQRTPRREVVEAAAFSRPEGLVRQRAAGRQLDPVHALQRGALDLPRRVAIDECGRGRVSLAGATRLAQPATVLDVGELGDRLDPQVERVDEAPGRRQVRRRFHRRDGGRGVQRVHQDESGAMARRRPHRQVGEVGQIADAPRSFGSDAVELGGQPPGPRAAERGGHRQGGGRDDERGAGVGRAGLRVNLVVAERQVGRHFERRFADQPTVQLVGRPVVLQLPKPRAHRAVLQADPHADGIAVGDVHPERRGLPGPRDDGRRKAAPPVVPIMVEKRCGSFLFGRGGRPPRR